MRQVYGRLERCVLSAGKTHVHKIPRFGGGGGILGLGGGSADFILWARGFSEHATSENGTLSCTRLRVPLSRYTCRATCVAADFLDFIAFCRCSIGVALHPLNILVSHLPPPVPGGVAPKFGSEKVSRYTGVSQLQLRVSRYTVQLRTEVALQFSECCAAEVALQHWLFCSAEVISTKAAPQRTKNCTATLKKLRCRKVALSCRFPAPTFRHPRLGLAEGTSEGVGRESAGATSL